MPAWPVPMCDTQFVPIGPWNTDGLLVVPGAMAGERVEYLQSLMADRFPVVFAGVPELRPTVAVDKLAVQRLGLDGDPRLVVRNDQTDDLECGRQGVKELLARGVPFSALLAFNDWVTIGAMQALKGAGLRIPADAPVASSAHTLTADGSPSCWIARRAATKMRTRVSARFSSKMPVTGR